MEPPPPPSPAATNGRPSGYSSQSIVTRRRRILDEARKMIGEVGIANLSMDEVARRAEVAKRTLYNAFQSKERLVAAAIRQYFEDYEQHIHYHGDRATLERMLERLVIVARRNLEIRNYTRALMNVYHSHDADPEIRYAIHQIASQSHEPWIRELERKRQLQPWIGADELIDMLVRYRYATAHAWTEGSIADDALVVQLVRGFLTFVAGATRGAARKEIVDVLAGLATHPLLGNVKAKPARAPASRS